MSTLNSRYIIIGGIIILLTLFLGIYFDTLVPVLLPIAIVGAALVFFDFKLVFYILLFFLPLSVEVYFDNGFGTDLPDEPLMVLLMGVFLFYLIGTGKGIKAKLVWHPITLVLMLHVAWIAFTSITSLHMLTSIKFLLAKVWYVVVFYFMAAHILKTKKDIFSFIWVIVAPLTFTIIYTLVRHAQSGFSFAEIHNTMYPFFRNHVNYAALVSIVLPLMVYSLYLTDNLKKKRIIKLSLIVLIPLYLVAIYFSYTRAAYVVVVLFIPGYFLLRWSLIKPAIIAALIIIPIGLFNMLDNNKFLEYAPDYKKAITHFEFDDLVEATYNLEDISTMERVYRWVGSYYMFQERPVLGFGPGNFYNYYRRYTISKFKTYVSNNPEKSGIHNYYLMVLVEQGLIGLLIFLSLIVMAFLTAQRVYNNIEDKSIKATVMLSFLGILGILALLLINDLIETDKIGPFFFIFLALIANADVKLNNINSKTSINE